MPTCLKRLPVLPGEHLAARLVLVTVRRQRRNTTPTFGHGTPRGGQGVAQVTTYKKELLTYYHHVAYNSVLKELYLCFISVLNMELNETNDRFGNMI